MRSWLLLLLILGFTQTSLSGDKDVDPKCTKALAGEEHEDENSKVAYNYEAQVYELIEAYEGELFPYADPFMGIFDVTMHELIYRSLQKRKYEGEVYASPLNLVLNRLLIPSGEEEVDVEFVDMILSDARALLEHSRANSETFQKQDYQSNYVALNQLLTYLGRFHQVDQAFDEEPDESDEQQEDEKEEKQDQSESSEDEDQEPDYPDTTDSGEAQNNDTEGDSGNQKKHVVAELNFVSPFFSHRVLSDITVTPEGRATYREVPLPQQPLAPANYRDTPKKLKIKTFGHNELRLFVPPGHTLLQSSDPRVRVSRDKTGGYILKLTQNLAVVELPIVEEFVELNPILEAVYTRPTGTSVESWPDEFYTHIFRKYPPGQSHNVLQLAEDIRKFIATEFLYSVDETSEKSIFEMIASGSFQCDTASVILTSILRDVYGIPSRIIGGFRGKTDSKNADNNGKSFLITPDTPHAFTEVYHEGKWHDFDPTPINKDRKSDNEGTENPYSDISPHDDEGDQEQNDGGEETGSQSEKSNDSDSNSEAGEDVDLSDLSERVAKDTQEKIDQAGIGQSDENESESTSATERSDANREESNQGDNSEVQMSDVDLDDDISDLLELGSLDLDLNQAYNPIVHRAIRLMARFALEPTKGGMQNLKRLNGIQKYMRYKGGPEIYSIVSEAAALHNHPHGNLSEWLESITSKLPKRDINETYQELRRLTRSLELYASTLDSDGSLEYPRELLRKLKTVMAYLRQMEHADAADIAIVQDFHDNLPPVVQRILAQDYGLASIGPNSATREVAKKIRDNSLSDLRLLSILYPESNFIMNSTPRVAYREARTWQRDYSRPVGRDLMKVKKFSEFPNAIKGQPHLSKMENFKQGTLYTLTTRRRVLLPDGVSSEEAERVTVVCYDTSGSMSGSRGDFQAGLLSAFTGRALSDISPAGRHRHKVLLIPFDQNPHTPVRVTNSTEAIDVLRNYREVMKNTNGGTNITNCMLQAMALIADAERRGGQPLAAANLIVMSDGDDHIKPDQMKQLEEARRSIDRDTPLQTMFISIDTTNEALMRFAYSSDREEMGFSEGLYKHFARDVIDDALRKSQNFKVENPEDYFYTDKAPKQIPPVVRNLLRDAEADARVFLNQVYRSQRFVTAEEHFRNIDRPGIYSRDLDRDILEWIQKFRREIEQNIEWRTDPMALQRAMDDIMKNLESIIGQPYERLDVKEQEAIKFALQEVTRIVNGAR